MSQLTKEAVFPSVMRDKLRSVRWRQATLSAARAVAVAVSVLIATMIIAMMIDWCFTIFDTRVRILLTTTSLTVSSAALLFVGLRPIIAAFGWTRAASRVDEKVPLLEERWRTVASFAESDHQPATPMARAMLQQVTSEAVAMGTLVKPGHIVQAVSMRRPAITLAVTVLCLTGFMLINRHQTSVLLRRFWSPTLNVSATQLQCVTGDVVVPRGQSVEIVTQMIGLQRDSAVMMMKLTSAEGSGNAEAMDLKPVADHPGELRLVVDVDESFQYRIQAGDGRTEWHSVTAIDFPFLSDVRLTITPPDYVDEPVIEKTLIPGRIRAIQGSQFELAMKSDMELKTLRLVLTMPAEEIRDGDVPVPPETGENDGANEGDAAPKMIRTTLTLTRADDGWYHFETQLVEDFALTPLLLSPHGLTNENPRVCRIEVIADKAPVARIISPTDESFASPDEIIEIKFEAHDDHGIATAELVIYDSETKEGEEPKILAIKEIPLGDQQDQKHLMGKTELDLKELGLEDGKTISYTVRVTDNRMLEMDPAALRNRLTASAEPQMKPEGEPGEPNDEEGRNDPEDPANENQIARLDDSEQDHNGKPNDSKSGNSQNANDQPKDGEPRDGEPEDGEPKDGEPKNGEPKNGDAKDGDAKDGDAKDGDAKDGDAKDGDAKDGEPKDGEPKDTAVAKTDAPQSPSSNEGNPKAGNPNPSNLAQPNKNKTGDSKTSKSSGEPPSKIQMKMAGQRNDAGQQKETNRRKLKITDRLDALAARNDEQKQGVGPVREKVIAIDRMLAVIELKLGALYKHEVEDNLRGDGFRELDVRLGDVETFIADLNMETRESAFEFVGLQMVDIGSSHVTPARDAVFIAIRTPDSGADAHCEEALHHVVSARELLQALLRKYDRVQQEQELAKKLDEAIKMYTVYVEGTQQLLREAQQNFDPLKLQRQMAVVQVDQAYLDRLAEVVRMRRDMMSELARILSDDPRLRARYLDMIKRNRQSLRSQLAEITDRQEQIALEVSGWLQVSENQRENYWMQVSDLRLDLPRELAGEAQQFADRIEKQMPLVLKATQGTPALIIQLTKQIAIDVRRCDFEVRELRKSGEVTPESTALSTSAHDLVFRISELAAALDQLNFENQNTDGVADYVQLRLAENRALADQADTWAETATMIEQKNYSGLAQIDQQQVNIATELLRINLLDIEADLAGQFQDEPMPQELTNLTQELLTAMESVTFNQSSASFALTRDRNEAASAQQELALEGLEQSARILDQLRRKTIEVLDKQDVPDPNIADLRDPTLDEFLANLEREPNIEAQLGIPNRPRNIRVLQDMMQFSQNGGMMLGGSSAAAAARMQQQMKQQLNINGEGKKEGEKPGEARQITDEEKKQLAESKDMQEMLKQQMQQTIQELEERAKDQNQSEAERKQLQELAQRMKDRLEEMNSGQRPEDMWKRMVETDNARAAMEALAKGESIPDEQWNKLMSSLDDGIWQVGGRTPPEDYRRAIEQYQDRIRKLTGGGE